MATYIVRANNISYRIHAQDAPGRQGCPASAYPPRALARFLARHENRRRRAGIFCAVDPAAVCRRR